MDKNILEFTSYKVEKKAKSIVEVEVTVKKELYEDFKDKAYIKLAPTVKIPGFRPGLAPKNAIEGYLGASLIEESINIMLPEVLIRVLEKENLSPIDQVKYDIKDLDVNKEIKFVATFTVYPEIKLPNLSDIKVEKEVVVTTEEEVTKAIEKVIEDVKNNEKDEEKKKNISLTDEFVKNLGIEAKTVDDFKKQVKSEIEAQKKMMAEDKYKMEVIKAVNEKITFDIPDFFIDLEVQAKEKDYSAKIQNLGIKIEDFLSSQKMTLDDLRKTWKEEAGERIKTEIMLLQVSKEHSVKVNDEDIQKEIDKIQDPKLKSDYDTDEGKRYIFSVLIQQKSLEKLIELVGK